MRAPAPPSSADLCGFPPRRTPARPSPWSARPCPTTSPRCTMSVALALPRPGLLELADEHGLGAPHRRHVQEEADVRRQPHPARVREPLGVKDQGVDRSLYLLQRADDARVSRGTPGAPARKETLAVPRIPHLHDLEPGKSSTTTVAKARSPCVETSAPATWRTDPRSRAGPFTTRDASCPCRRRASAGRQVEVVELIYPHDGTGL